VCNARQSSDAGFALVEVLVSAVLVVIISVTVLAGIDSSSRASGRQRTLSQGSVVAQQQLETVRALPPAQLAGYVTSPPADTTVTTNGVTYTINTTADWLDDTTSGAACSGSANVTRYLRVAVKVTWTDYGKTRTQRQQTLVSVPSGGGRLIVQVWNRSKGVQGDIPVTLSKGGTPLDTIRTSTAAGCVEWDYLAAGSDYSVSLSKPGSATFVDFDGNPTPSKAITIVDGQANLATFDYDQAGSVTINFYSQFSGTQPKLYPPSNPLSGMDQLTAVNSGMTGPRVFGAAGSLQPSITASNLFPFAGSTYRLHPGLCLPQGSGIPNAPNGAPPFFQDVTVTPGSSQTLEIRLPEFDINTRYKTSSGGTYVAAANARIVLDRLANNPSCPAVRLPDRYTTSTGDLPFAGVLSGYYDACAEVTVGANKFHRNPNGSVDVRDFNAPASYQFDIPAYTSSGSQYQGGCP
jgi:Tfp pilus assembly protein PilV